MQYVDRNWEETNRDYFTRPATVIVTIYQSDELSPIIGGNNIGSFTHEKSGDILSGILTQDKVTVVINDPEDRYNFADESGNSIYKNAKMKVTEGFLRPDSPSYYGIDGGIYYISSVDSDSYQRKFTITAASILAFMTEKLKDIDGVMSASELVDYVISQANQSKYVPSNSIPVEYDSSLDNITVEFNSSDNYSLAETLQLIANACSCILYVDRKGVIQIQKLGDICEHYVLSGKILYEPLSVEFADRIGNIELSSNHGHTTTHTQFEGDNIGALQKATNVILNDDDATTIRIAIDMLYKLKAASKTYTANCRIDPALDLFDMIAVPYGKTVVLACVVGIDAEFTGAWKGNIKAVTVDNVLLDLRICDIELLTIQQFESLRIEQLEPNTISDIDGDFMASKNGELAYWNGDD